MRSANLSVSIVVCDPCPLIFLGLQRYFEDDARFRIASEVDNLQDLSKKVQEESADIALVDWHAIDWISETSLNLIREITQQMAVVLFGMRKDAKERKLAFDLGIRGIINKRHSAHQVRQGLSKVADGKLWFEPGDAETLLHHLYNPGGDAAKQRHFIEQITRREHDVIRLVCRGLRNKQIAAELCISETTVWHHLSSIFSKLGVSDRVGLVTLAFQHGLYPGLPVPTAPGNRSNRNISAA